MARPNGSRNIRGWTATPNDMATAGVSLADVEKGLSETQEKAVLAAVQERKSGIPSKTNVRLSNDRAGQYDDNLVLSLSDRTKLAEDFVNKGRGGMTERQARSFVKKANTFAKGKVREYRKNKTIVLADNTLYAMSSNDFVRVGKFRPDGQIGD